MSLCHAVAWIHHHHAKILLFDAEHMKLRKIQAHAHYTLQHGSEAREELAFFGEVCDDLAEIQQIVVAGSYAVLSDFRHYVTQHTPHLLPQITGWEPVDHLTEAQVVVMSRKYFVAHDSMSATPLERPLGSSPLQPAIRHRQEQHFSIPVKN